MTDHTRYRKKPVEIHAIQWTGQNTRAVMSWTDNYFGLNAEGTGGWIWNKSQSSNNHVNVGDWIIRGTEGEYYPCEASIFAATYVPAVPAARPATPTDTDPTEPRIEVWPLARVLAEVQCGSQDWSWEEEWADLDRRHVETGYLAKLEEQIRENGITMPVLIGSDGRLWDGHHRLRIAVRLGIGYVPVEITSRADAVLAVLPAATDTDPAGLRDRIAEVLTAKAYECDGKCGLSERECYDAHPITFSAMCNGTTHIDAPVTAIADAVLAVLPAPADRAAVLRDAADAVFALDYDDLVSEQDDENLGSMREAWDLGTIHASQLLRRMADETASSAPSGPRPTTTGAERAKVLSEIIGRITGAPTEDSITEDAPATLVLAVLEDLLAEQHSTAAAQPAGGEQ